jgi:hypothetical protein
MCVGSPDRNGRFLIVLFLLTLPLSNPWVRGDGVGYYAFARSLLIEHRLDFQKHWLEANQEFRLAHRTLRAASRPPATRRQARHESFFDRPAILWAPLLIVTHAGVSICDALGAPVAADGFFEALRHFHGIRDRNLRFSGAVDFLPSRATLCCRTLGFSWLRSGCGSPVRCPCICI